LKWHAAFTNEEVTEAYEKVRIGGFVVKEARLSPPHHMGQMSQMVAFVLG